MDWFWGKEKEKLVRACIIIRSYNDHSCTAAHPHEKRTASKNEFSLNFVREGRVENLRKILGQYLFHQLRVLI